MAVLLLSGILVLAVGACGCVVWAARGGPRWVRAVSAVTLSVSELTRQAGRSRQRPGFGRQGDSGGSGE